MRKFRNKHKKKHVNSSGRQKQATATCIMLVSLSFGKTFGTALGLVTMLTARPPPPNVAGLQRSRQMKKCVTKRPRQREEVASLFYLWECSKAVYKGVLLHNCFCSIILLSDRCWDSGWGRATLTPLHYNARKSIHQSKLYIECKSKSIVY